MGKSRSGPAGFAHGIRVHRPLCADTGPRILQRYGQIWNQQKVSSSTKISLWLAEDPADDKGLLGWFLCELNLSRTFLLWTRHRPYDPFSFWTGSPPHIFGWLWGQQVTSGSLSSGSVFPLLRGGFFALILDFYEGYIPQIRFFIQLLQHYSRGFERLFTSFFGHADPPEPWIAFEAKKAIFKSRDGTKSRGGSLVPTPWYLAASLSIFMQVRAFLLLQPLSVRRPAAIDRLVGDTHSSDLVLDIGTPDLEKGWSKKADLSDLNRSRKKQYGVLPDLEQKCEEQDLAIAERVAPMQVFIKTTAGSHVCMQIWDKMKVMDLKEEIQVKLGFPVTTQILIFSRQCMQDQLSLQHYKVAKDSTIVLTHRLRGGTKGASSKFIGSYCDAAKGKGSPRGKEPTAAHTPPGQYIVDQAPENPSISLDLPEVKYIFTDLIKNAVICRFNGFWPKTDALYQWIHTTWTENCQINLCSKGFFIVNFYTEEEKEKILSEGPWFWGNAGLFITPWFPEFDPNTMVVTRMPVWVRLHNLPIHFWHHNTLSVIGNTLGRMLKVDPERHIKGIFTFARICVEVDLSKGLPESIILTFNNTRWKQPLDYENTTFRCRGCQQTGHLLNACKSQNKNKPQQRKPKGWQNIDELMKKNAAEKKASSNKEDEETEGEDDDTTTENDETGNQKENTSDQKTPQLHTNQAEIQHEQVVLTSTDHGMGGNKRQHHPDSSDSDKETGLQKTESHLVIVPIEPTQGEWRKVEKKKGRKF